MQIHGGPLADIRETKGVNLNPKFVSPFSRALKKANIVNMLENMCRSLIAALLGKALQIFTGDAPIAAQPSCRQFAGLDPAANCLGADAKKRGDIAYAEISGIL
jgi:hypothetical protein